MEKTYNQYLKIIPCRAGQEKELFKTLSWDLKRKERLFREIRAAKTDKQRKNKIKFYMSSFPVCKLALIEAGQKRSQLYTPEELDNLALEVSKHKNILEPIYVCEREKKGQGTRIISRPGIKRHAVQIIVRDILKLLNIGHEQDCIINGGRDAGIYDLTSCINKNNYPVVVTSDLKDFYGSIEQNEVKKLLHLFPQDVVEFCVLNHKRHKIYFNSLPYTQDDFSQLKRKVQRGLPQGSPCSVRIASALFGNLVEGITELDRMVWQGDDLAICASSYSEAAAIKATLIDRCKTHPAGPFRLKFLKINYVTESFHCDGMPS